MMCLSIPTCSSLEVSNLEFFECISVFIDFIDDYSTIAIFIIRVSIKTSFIFLTTWDCMFTISGQEKSDKRILVIRISGLTTVQERVMIAIIDITNLYSTKITTHIFPTHVKQTFIIRIIQLFFNIICP